MVDVANGEQDRVQTALGVVRKGDFAALDTGVTAGKWSKAEDGF